MCNKQGVQSTVFICSPDTDDLVLAIHYFPQMTHPEQLWSDTGRTAKNVDQRRFIAVHEIRVTNHPLFAEILPAVPRLTGCDTTLALFKTGKKLIKIVLQDNITKHYDLTSFGENTELDVTTG